MKLTKKLITLALAALMLLSLAVPAMAADGVITKATVTKTNIKADSVFNAGGYGSLNIEGVYNYEHGTYDDENGVEHDYEYPSAVVRSPQVALIDKNGKYVFSYRESFNNFRYDPDSGIVSLTAAGPYNYADDSSLAYIYDPEIEESTYPIYYKLDGSVAFSLKDKWAGAMHNGFAIVFDFGDYMDYHSYVVDKTGKKAFDLPSEFSEFIAGGFNYMGMKHQIYSFSEGLGVCAEESYGDDDDSYYYKILGYMDTKGKMALDLSKRGYENAGRFSDGLAWVVKDGKVGFIDKTGKEVIAPQYDGAYAFCGGFAAVEKNGKYGFIDKTGKTVIPFEYETTYGPGEGLMAIEKNGKCGLINTKNEVVVPFEYDDISTYEYGAAYAIKDGYVYVITAAESIPTTPTTSATTNFTDVPANAWFAEPVAWAVEKGITSGTGNNKFSPNNTCNNSEILTFLWRACGKPSAPEAGFSDVASGAWYADAANWAKSKGMVSGDKLSPTEPCTRASAVMFIWQAMGKPTASKAAAFTDVPANADYAAAVAWAVEKGVTNGTGADTFSPGTICTRAQIVAFLQRAYAEA